MDKLCPPSAKLTLLGCFAGIFLLAALTGRVPSWLFPEVEACLIINDSCMEDEKVGKTIHGSLEPTVEPGGWIVRDENTGETFLLMPDNRSILEQPWIQAGVRVKATGYEEAGTPTFFMQGTPFRVLQLERIR